MNARIGAGIALALLGACKNPPAPGVGPPSHYRIQAVTFELPLAAAEQAWRAADEREPTLSVGFDQDGQLRRAVDELVRSGADVQRRAWDEATTPDETWVRLRASDAALARELELSVRPLFREAWAPLALDVSVTWRDARGEILVRLPSSAQPVPQGACVRVICLPSRASFARDPDHVRARMTFIRATPLADAP
jgi:hypothetical protein